MLNILPLSILQSWGLWQDFDGVHADAYQNETVAEEVEVLDIGWGPWGVGVETQLPREGDRPVTTSTGQMGFGEQWPVATVEDDRMDLTW